MPLLGSSVLTQAESWDKEEKIYSISLAVVWSPKLQENAVALATGEAVPSSSKGKFSPQEWLAQQDLTTMIGPRRFTDNEGNNISELNISLNEMTAMYWFIKHYEEIGNPEYFGFFHYRRFLNFKLEDLNKNKINVISINLNNLNIYSQLLSNATNDACQKFINTYILLNPDDAKLMTEFLSYQTLYICNIFIMHKEYFIEYGKFIEKCIDIAKLFVKYYSHDLIKYPRMYGHMLERMTSFYLFKLQKTKNIEMINTPVIGELVNKYYG
jgi:hypothetical protein